jgi:mannose-6-phosphate isomerase-like protein (cupin superfamily)
MMKYIKIYADETGESHFSDEKIKLSSVVFAPPAPPFYVSKLSPATRYGFCVFEVGWLGDWHPAPRRQFFFFFRGELEVTVSDGEVRRIRSGDIVLVEDTTGRGHITRVVGSEEAHAAIVQLPE